MSKQVLELPKYLCWISMYIFDIYITYLSFSFDLLVFKVVVLRYILLKRVEMYVFLNLFQSLLHTIVYIHMPLYMTKASIG